MVIVLQPDISAREKAGLREFLARRNFRVNELKGEEETVLAAVGKLSLDVREVALLPGVSRVVPISKPYKLASREFKRDDTVVQVACGGSCVRVGGSRIAVIAGPCAVESRAQVLQAARAVAHGGAVMLKGGAFVPRLSPYGFHGLGKKALPLLRDAGGQCGLPVCMEVLCAEHVDLMAGYADVFLVGPQNMRNGVLLQRLAAAKTPVIICREPGAGVEELLLAAENVLSGGNPDVMLCTGGAGLDLSDVPVLKELTHLPVLVAPGDWAGSRDRMLPASRAAIAGGADGLVLDVHAQPEQALCGGATSLSPVQFEKLMHDVEALAPVVAKSVLHVRDVPAPRENAAARSAKTASRSAKNAAASPAQHTAKATGQQCAYAGKKGAYAEQAIARYFDGSGVTAAAQDSFAQIFSAVASGSVKFGMVPIENSLAGSVYQNYDNFLRFEDVHITGSVMLNIRHSLLGVRGASLSDIRAVHSHPQALSQCRRFLEGHPDWSLVDAASTATAAQEVGARGVASEAAIASAVNAGLYGLDVLAEDIEDDPGNFTRFVVIERLAAKKGRGRPRGRSPNTASILFKVKNEPGSLCRALGVFEQFSINLTRLESRPISGEPWRYWFYADADVGGVQEEPCAYTNRVLDALRAVADTVRLLGLYSEVTF